VEDFGLVVAQLNRIRLQLDTIDGLAQRSGNLLKGFAGDNGADHISSICRISDNQAPAKPFPRLLELLLMSSTPPLVARTHPAPERLNLLMVGEARPRRCRFVGAAYK